MIRRIVAFTVWAYLGWYAAAYVLMLFDMPTALAPLGGAVMIVVVGVDWRALGGASAPEPVDTQQRTT